MFRIIIPSKRVMSYGDNDVMFILETLERNLRSGKRAGRADVADSTCIGEGIVRTILTRLNNMGFLDITKRGITLSGTGIDFLDTLGISLMDLERTDSAIGGYQVALLIKGKAELIQKGIEQRNSALKAGGDGCTTIICKGGRLILPPDWDVDESSPSMSSQIRSHGIEEGDVVLIGGSNTGRREAAAAANSAAMELVG